MTTVVKIINWQLSPYLRETVDLLPNDIMTVFSEDNDSDILTAALNNISQTNPNIYSQDKHIFSKDLNTLSIYPTVFAISVGGRYFGHVYTWVSKSSTNVVGLNAIESEKIIECLLSAVENSSEEKYIRIIQPIKHISEILLKRGYKLIKTVKDSKLIFDTKLIGNTPLMKNMLFRENDYIFYQ